MGRRFRLGANTLTKVILPSSNTPTYTNLTVIPTTTAQNYNVPSGYTAYNQITVSAVNSNIDANIQPGNIRNGVNILGVMGNYTPQTYYIERTLATGNKLTGPSSILQTQGILDIGDNALREAYHYDDHLQGEICFPDLVTVSGNNAMFNCFYNCTNITSVNFPNLVTLPGTNCMYNAFYGCTNVTSVNLCNLTNASGTYALQYGFCGCHNLSSLNLSNLTIVDHYAMERAFLNTKLTTLNLCNLTTIRSGGLYYSFGVSNYLTTVNFPALTSVGSSGLAWAFMRCNNLTTISFPSLVTITATGTYAFNEAFRNCISLTSVYFNQLSSVISTNTFLNSFKDCTSLPSINFPALSVINKANIFKDCFNGCIALRSVNFPALTTSSFGTVTSQFSNMLSGVTDCIVHFPSSIQSTIGTWSDVTGGFGGTNCRAAFDLPATS